MIVILSIFFFIFSFFWFTFGFMIGIEHQLKNSRDFIRKNYDKKF